MSPYYDADISYREAKDNGNWRKLKEVLDELKLIQAYSEKFLRNFDELRRRRLQVLRALLEQAKDYEAVVTISLRKDDKNLLLMLENLIDLENRYMRKLNRKIKTARSIIWYVSTYNPETFKYSDIPLAEELLRKVLALFDIILEGMDNLGNRLYMELTFLDDWRAGKVGGVFHIFRFVRNKISANFRQNVQSLIEKLSSYSLYEEDLTRKITQSAELLEQDHRRLTITMKEITVAAAEKASRPSGIEVSGVVTPGADQYSQYRDRVENIRVILTTTANALAVAGLVTAILNRDKP